MATFASTQSGDWDDSATWGGMGVPDMSVDDALINSGHEVVVPYSLYVSVYDGRAVIVAGNATLRIQGGMDIGDGMLIVLGYVIAEGSHLALWGSTTAEIWSSGYLEVQSNFYLDGATMTVDGYFSVYGGYAEIEYGCMLTITSSGTWEIYGSAYIEYDGQVRVEGTLYVDNYASLDLYDYSTLTISQDGWAYVYGYFYIYYYSVMEVFGWFGLAEEGWMYVDYEGLVNVYRDIRISGRLMGYGGKIAMLRREGRIYDFYDNLLFVLDRAYGFDQTRIA